MGGIGYNLFYARYRSIAENLDKFIEPELLFPEFYSLTEIPSESPEGEIVPICSVNDIDTSIELDKRFLSKHETAQTSEEESQ